MGVYAQTLGLPGGFTITGPDGLTTAFGGSFRIGNIVSRALPLVFAFSGMALLLIIMKGGFTLLTSAGNPKRIESGKQQITTAIIGFFIIFLAYWIVQIFGIILGFDEIKTIFGP